MLSFIFCIVSGHLNHEGNSRLLRNRKFPLHCLIPRKKSHLQFFAAPGGGGFP